MKRSAILFLAACLLLTPLVLVAQDDDAGTSDTESSSDRVRVTLVQVDALVMDKQGKTVDDLTKDDFELKIGNQALEIATLDLDCPIGATEDPKPMRNFKNLPPKIGENAKRRIVMAFDYYFLSQTMQPQVLEAAAQMLEWAHTQSEEIMIVALAYGVRVEQRFTTDTRALTTTLRRMEHDVTLFGMDYRIGSTGKEYFQDLTTLVDVLGGYPGSKAIVLFSEATAIGAMNDLWFNDVAMHAALAQAAFYPANPVMLQSRGVSEGLARLANQSGGRMGFFDGDMSIPYRQAQRDMSCRYTVGAYLDDEQGRQRKEIQLSVKREDLHIRHPEMIKLFTDDEKLVNRQRAAFVDPGPYENPLVRMFAFPAHPATASRWDTLIGLSFPAPVKEGGNDINIKGELKKAINKTRIDKYDATFHIDPPEGGGDTRAVTILGDTTLKEGGYIFTAVLREEDGDEIVAADTQIQVPPVLSDLVILRGPIFARVVPGGKLFRADAKEKIEDTKLDQILGGDKSIEPMLVNEVDANEEFLAYWNACVQGKVKLTGPAVVKRRVYTEQGELVVELDEIPLNLANVGKKLFCHDAMSVVPANSLEPGEYEVDVLITYTNGDRISHGSAPLHVK